MTAPFRTLTWTGWSPTLAAASATVGGTTGTVMQGESNFDPKISQLFRKPQFRGWRRLLYVLIGAAAGSSAVENRARVLAEQAGSSSTSGALGGLRTIETVSLVPTASGAGSPATRNSAAADVTYLKAMLDRLSALAPASYPTDLSGNTGGGKLGF